MIVTLQIQGLKTLAHVPAFVASSEAISFTLTDRTAAYGWITDTLKQFHYRRCMRAQKGVLRQYLRRVTGLSRAQVARCIRQFTDGGIIQDRRQAPAAPFVQRYTAEDIRLLVEIDALQAARSPAPPRASRASGRSRCTVMPASNGWRAFPTAICITSAQAQDLSGQTGFLRPNPSDPSQYRRAPQTGTERPPRLSARGQRASGRCRRHQRRVPD